MKAKAVEQQWPGQAEREKIPWALSLDLWWLGTCGQARAGGRTHSRRPEQFAGGNSYPRLPGQEAGAEMVGDSPVAQPARPVS